MGKKISPSGAGAIRTILKSLDDFHADLRTETEDKGKISRVYDFFYENINGTFTIVTNGEEVEIAVLNISNGKIINLHNDLNIRKLAEYVLKNS
ncbi:hypothetical protein [Ileibacterium valens]|uniref:Uncharacterized protein n=1 Tax=Ileibacterium valens TaxID=1862668 RepID=A0A1U7NH87_9FIRM|nr:hypothetical protein [Ileibacterium valens]OLU36357.1 hypothetical protein BM735_12465 [Erysipelotrichaceae bacterium NYU-BL-F16]OLU40159.1 hypothetical protein BO224_06110 [Erysipelotrichaceae bacterium NYU-BL-E8]OLU40903.1 hypothetical protein BO222_04140 [Ileibacterium valens]